MKTKTYLHPLTKIEISKKEYMDFIFGSKFIIAKSKGDLVDLKTIQQQLNELSPFNSQFMDTSFLRELN